MSRRKVSLCLKSALIAAFAALVSAQASADSLTPPVQTKFGPVKGTLSAARRQFLGIRYGASPAGANRWKPTLSPAKWTTPMNATAFAKHCPQPPSPFGSDQNTAEDCLFLNVFTPKVPGTGRPVMVWIHGGALFLGQSDDYDPQQLVDQGVIVVTVNYRLGALGFLAHPALSAESPGTAGSGNYGFMDQQAALKWVKDSIRNFGGDPKNVTVFGQSAGGLSTHVHLSSPKSAGLLNKAIVESGAITLDPLPLATAEGLGLGVAARLGCTTPMTALACLRAAGVADILAQQETPGIIGFLPNLDANILPRTFRDAFTSGAFNKVPVVEGATHDEWSLFVALRELQFGPLGAADYPAAIEQTLGQGQPLPPPVLAGILATYPLANYASPSEALTAVGTDGIFACNAYSAAKLLAKFVPTFFYEFNDSNAPEYPPFAAIGQTLPGFPSFPLKAYHLSEIPYVGLRLAPFPAPTYSADQSSLIEDMVRYWAQFAKLSNPNGLGTPLWPRLDGLIFEDRIQSLVPPRPQTRVNYYVGEHRCAFWNALSPAP